MNCLLHSCALTSAPPWTSRGSTQSLPQVHPHFQPQMHLLVHVYIDLKVHLYDVLP